MPVLANLTVLSLLVLLLTVEGLLPVAVEAVVVPMLLVAVPVVLPVLAVVLVLLCCAFCAAKARSSAALVAA